MSNSSCGVRRTLQLGAGPSRCNAVIPRAYQSHQPPTQSSDVDHTTQYLPSAVMHPSPTSLIPSHLSLEASIPSSRVRPVPTITSLTQSPLTSSYPRDQPACVKHGNGPIPVPSTRHPTSTVNPTKTLRHRATHLGTSNARMHTWSALPVLSPTSSSSSPVKERSASGESRNAVVHDLDAVWQAAVQPAVQPAVQDAPPSTTAAVLAYLQDIVAAKYNPDTLSFVQRCHMHAHVAQLLEYLLSPQSCMVGDDGMSGPVHTDSSMDLPVLQHSSMGSSVPHPSSMGAPVLQHNRVGPSVPQDSSNAHMTHSPQTTTTNPSTEHSNQRRGTLDSKVPSPSHSKGSKVPSPSHSKGSKMHSPSHSNTSTNAVQGRSEPLSLSRKEAVTLLACVAYLQHLPPPEILDRAMQAVLVSEQITAAHTDANAVSRAPESCERGRGKEEEKAISHGGSMGLTDACLVAQALCRLKVVPHPDWVAQHLQQCQDRLQVLIARITNEASASAEEKGQASQHFANADIHTDTIHEGQSRMFRQSKDAEMFTDDHQGQVSLQSLQSTDVKICSTPATSERTSNPSDKLPCQAAADVDTDLGRVTGVTGSVPTGIPMAAIRDEMMAAVELSTVLSSMGCRLPSSWLTSCTAAVLAMMACDPVQRVRSMVQLVLVYAHQELLPDGELVEAFKDAFVTQAQDDSEDSQFDGADASSRQERGQAMDVYDDGMRFDGADSMKAGRREHSMDVYTDKIKVTRADASTDEEREHPVGVHSGSSKVDGGDGRTVQERESTSGVYRDAPESGVIACLTGSELVSMLCAMAYLKQLKHTQAGNHEWHETVQKVVEELGRTDHLSILQPESYCTVLCVLSELQYNPSQEWLSRFLDHMHPHVAYLDRTSLVAATTALSTFHPLSVPPSFSTELLTALSHNISRLSPPAFLALMLSLQRMEDDIPFTATLRRQYAYEAVRKMKHFDGAAFIAVCRLLVWLQVPLEGAVGTALCRELQEREQAWRQEGEERGLVGLQQTCQSLLDTGCITPHQLHTWAPHWTRDKRLSLHDDPTSPTHSRVTNTHAQPASSQDRKSTREGTADAHEQSLKRPRTEENGSQAVARSLADTGPASQILAEVARSLGGDLGREEGVGGGVMASQKSDERQHEAESALNGVCAREVGVRDVSSKQRHESESAMTHAREVGVSHDSHKLQPKSESAMTHTREVGITHESHKQQPKSESAMTHTREVGITHESHEQQPKSESAVIAQRVRQMLHEMKGLASNPKHCTATDLIQRLEFFSPEVLKSMGAPQLVGLLCSLAHLSGAVPRASMTATADNTGLERLNGGVVEYEQDHRQPKYSVDSRFESQNTTDFAVEGAGKVLKKANDWQQLMKSGRGGSVEEENAFTVQTHGDQQGVEYEQQVREQREEVVSDKKGQVREHREGVPIDAQARVREERTQPKTDSLDIAGTAQSGAAGVKLVSVTTGALFEKPVVTGQLTEGIGSKSARQMWAPDQAWLQGCVAEVEKKMNALHPGAVTEVVWALAKLGFAPAPEPVRKLLGRVERGGGFRRLKPKNLSNVVYGLGLMGVAPEREWMQGFLSAAAEQLPAFSTQAQSNLVYGLARMRHPTAAGWVVEQWCPATQQTLLLMSPQELSNSMWALATLHAAPTSSWMEAAMAAAANHLPRMCPQEVSNFIYACALLDYTPPDDVVDLVLQQALKYLTPMPQAESKKKKTVPFRDAVSNTSQSNEQVSLSSPQLPMFKSQELANFIWALGVLRLSPSDAWSDIFFQRTADTVSQFSSVDLAATIYGLGRLGVVPPSSWMNSILSASSSRLVTLAPRELSSVLTGLSSLGILPPAQWLRGYVSAWKLQRSCAAAVDVASCYAATSKMMKVVYQDGQHAHSATQEERERKMSTVGLTQLQVQTVASLLVSLAEGLSQRTADILANDAAPPESVPPQSHTSASGDQMKKKSVALPASLAVAILHSAASMWASLDNSTTAGAARPHAAHAVHGLGPGLARLKVSHMLKHISEEVDSITAQDHVMLLWSLTQLLRVSSNSQLSKHVVQSVASGQLPGSYVRVLEDVADEVVAAVEQWQGSFWAATEKLMPVMSMDEMLMVMQSLVALRWQPTASWTESLSHQVSFRHHQLQPSARIKWLWTVCLLYGAHPPLDLVTYLLSTLSPHTASTTLHDCSLILCVLGKLAAARQLPTHVLQSFTDQYCSRLLDLCQSPTLILSQSQLSSAKVANLCHALSQLHLSLTGPLSQEEQEEQLQQQKQQQSHDAGGSHVPSHAISQLHFSLRGPLPQEEQEQQQTQGQSHGSHGSHVPSIAKSALAAILHTVPVSTITAISAAHLGMLLSACDVVGLSVSEGFITAAARALLDRRHEADATQLLQLMVKLVKLQWRPSPVDLLPLLRVLIHTNTGPSTTTPSHTNTALPTTTSWPPSALASSSPPASHTPSHSGPSSPVTSSSSHPHSSSSPHTPEIAKDDGCASLPLSHPDSGSSPDMPKMSKARYAGLTGAGLVKLAVLLAEVGWESVPWREVVQLVEALRPWLDELSPSDLVHLTQALSSSPTPLPIHFLAQLTTRLDSHHRQMTTHQLQTAILALATCLSHSNAPLTVPWTWCSHLAHRTYPYPVAPLLTDTSTGTVTDTSIGTATDTSQEQFQQSPSLHQQQRHQQQQQQLSQHQHQQHSNQRTTASDTQRAGDNSRNTSPEIPLSTALPRPLPLSELPKQQQLLQSSLPVGAVLDLTTMLSSEEVDAPTVVSSPEAALKPPRVCGTVLHQAVAAMRTAGYHPGDVWVGQVAAAMEYYMHTPGMCPVACLTDVTEALLKWRWTASERWSHSWFDYTQQQLHHCTPPQLAQLMWCSAHFTPNIPPVWLESTLTELSLKLSDASLPVLCRTLQSLLRMTQRSPSLLTVLRPSWLVRFVNTCARRLTHPTQPNTSSSSLRPESKISSLSLRPAVAANVNGAYVQSADGVLQASYAVRLFSILAGLDRCVQKHRGVGLLWMAATTGHVSRPEEGMSQSMSVPHESALHESVHRAHESHAGGHVFQGEESAMGDESAMGGEPAMGDESALVDESPMREFLVDESAHTYLASGDTFQDDESASCGVLAADSAPSVHESHEAKYVFKGSNTLGTVGTTTDAARYTTPGGFTVRPKASNPVTPVTVSHAMHVLLEASRQLLPVMSLRQLTQMRHCCAYMALSPTTDWLWSWEDAVLTAVASLQQPGALSDTPSTPAPINSIVHPERERNVYTEIYNVRSSPDGAYVVSGNLASQLDSSVPSSGYTSGPTVDKSHLDGNVSGNWPYLPGGNVNLPNGKVDIPLGNGLDSGAGASGDMKQSGVLGAYRMQQETAFGLLMDATGREKASSGIQPGARHATGARSPGAGVFLSGFNPQKAPSEAHNVLGAHATVSSRFNTTHTQTASSEVSNANAASGSGFDRFDKQTASSQAYHAVPNSGLNATNAQTAAPEAYSETQSTDLNTFNKQTGLSGGWNGPLGFGYLSGEKCPAPGGRGIPGVLTKLLNALARSRGDVASVHFMSQLVLMLQWSVNAGNIPGRLVESVMGGGSGPVRIEQYAHPEWTAEEACTVLWSLARIRAHIPDTLVSGLLRCILEGRHSNGILEGRHSGDVEGAVGCAAVGGGGVCPLRQRQLCMTLWSLATLGCRPTEPWMDQLLSSCLCVLSSFMPHNLCLVAWALSRLGSKPPKAWLAAFLTRVHEVMDRVTPQGAARVLWALARWNVVPKKTWQIAYQEAVANMLRQGAVDGRERERVMRAGEIDGEGSLRERGQILDRGGCQGREREGEEHLDDAQQMGRERAEHVDDRDHQRRERDHQAKEREREHSLGDGGSDSSKRESVRHSDRMDSQALLLVLWSLAKMHPNWSVDSELVSLLVAELQPRLNQMSVRTLLTVGWCLQRLGHKPSAEWMENWRLWVEMRMASVEK